MLKKPMIVLGESLLNSSSSKYVFNKVKEFLNKNNKITNDWNAFNILTMILQQLEILILV